MGTFTQILYQIVYSTKHRQMTLEKNSRPRLFGFMNGILEQNKCHLYELNGVEDHLHIITHIHPSVALSDLIKDLKLGATDLIKTQHLFPDFKGWQDGYAAFTYSIKEKNNLIAYVKNQEIHHRKRSFVEELKDLLAEHQIPYDEKYLV